MSTGEDPVGLRMIHWMTIHMSGVFDLYGLASIKKKSRSRFIKIYQDQDQEHSSRGTETRCTEGKKQKS